MSDLYNNAAELTFTDKSTEYTEKVKANDLNVLVTAYTNLLNLGTETVSEKNQQKYIRITNFVAINSFVCALAYLMFAIFWEKWYWFEADLAFCLTCLVILWMNSAGKIKVSRLIFLAGGNLLIFVNGLIIGPATHSENFFIVSIILPFLVYDLRNRKGIALGVALPIILMSSYGYLSPYFTACNLEPGQQVILYHVGIIAQMLLTLSAVYQFIYYGRKAEEDLEITHQQMGLQTGELKRSNADLEQFAYIISHDLKAPVRNISSFMNLLASKYAAGMNPEAREFIEYSRAGAKRMERLIDDVLSYCRIGTNLPKPTPVNLNEVVNTIRFELRERLNNMNGSVNVSTELPIVNNVHSSLMYHVFQNLITNGLKFNKNEKPEINIYCTNSLNYYTFSVHDNGIGISKEFQTTVFQMFKRLHTESEYDGTGIGLAICKKIVNYYHGEIWFESEPGKGTTFNFTIRKF